MKIYRARAFASPDKIEGKEVIGNPASVVVCEGKFLSQQLMSKIAVDEAQPMTAFVKQRGSDEFDIRYFFLF